MSYFDLYALDLPDEDIDDESPNDVLYALYLLKYLKTGYFVADSC